MVLSQRRAVEQARIMLQWRSDEKERLRRVYEYLRNKYRFLWLPSDVPDELRKIAQISRVPVLSFVVNATVQAMYVDGYRTAQAGDNEPAWQLWQANSMDARQVGVHRAALAYGASYEVVLPGDPVPVIRGVSPRRMTAVYGEDDWPMWALEERRSAIRGEKLYRLFDDDAVYWLKSDPHGDSVEFISSEIHGVGHVPVVRFRETEDLDDDVIGLVEPLMTLQDQINITTFGLLVAQHYGAHRQRYIIGWLAESEEKALKASAQKLWTFDDSPDDVQVGEFQQTQLDGYIQSREASLRHLATISQTPVHELLGQLVNLSAEALVAARDSHNRRLEEHKTVMGESHEQALALGGRLIGEPGDPEAWVRWRDMDSRSLAQTADALGKLVQMLGVPPRELWERVPGVSQQEIERWKAAAEEGDAFAGLASLLDRQAGDDEGL